MKLFYLILLNALFAGLGSAYSQNAAPRADRWRDYLEELFPEAEDEAWLENLYYELSHIADNPFDINAAKEEELKRLPFLSDVQIRNIIGHRKANGNFLSTAQLRFVESIDARTFNLMLPFVHVARGVERFPLNAGNVLKRGRSNLILRYDHCLQQKKGYRSLPDSILTKYPNRQYMGEPFYHSLRYSYSFSDRLTAGFTAEKDAGEPFWNGHNRGYDFYSAQLFVKDAGWFKSIALGDYRASFGQGLVISSEFTPSKAATFTRMERRTYGFARHGSTNENDFLRGAALTVARGKIEVSAFYSFRNLDATLNDDGEVSSLKTDGLHRLPREADKKGILDMQTLGGNIRYSSVDKDDLHYPYTYFTAGITAIGYSFLNHSIEPDPKPYSLFYFRGNAGAGFSVDYSLENSLGKFYGETAISANRALATLNALLLYPASDIEFLVLHRYYDRHYSAFFGNAFAQSSSVRNEQGLYVGLKLPLHRNWRLASYADRFYCPWLNYGIDSPSTGAEYMAQLEYTGLENSNAFLYLRYKYRQKEKNSTASDRSMADIIPYTQHNIRLQGQYRIWLFELKTSVDAIAYIIDKSERGILVAQDLRCNPSKSVQLSLHAGWFNTDSYNTRLLSRERNLYYAYSSHQLYGKGLRLAAIVRWDIRRQLSLFVKAGDTAYADRDLIGTELEEIEGQHKTDFTFVLRWGI